jgi:predicted transporter
MFALSTAMSAFVPRVALGFYLLLSLLLIGLPMWQLRKYAWHKGRKGGSPG